MNENKFNVYYSELTAEQKADLASKAKTSVAYLGHISSGFRNAGWTTIQNLVKADSNISIAMFEKQ